MHHFQPLAPRYATPPGEPDMSGYNCWVKTWIANYASVEEIYWAGSKVDSNKLPSRAYDSPKQEQETQDLINEYNRLETKTIEIDTHFGALAAERIQAHPIRYYVLLPALRITDMWLRPRTEMLSSDGRWWKIAAPWKSLMLTIALGLLNLIYIGVACFALVFRRSGIRYLHLLLTFVVLRSAFLGTLQNPEPRYILECYPIVLILTAKVIEHRELHIAPEMTTG
jgi:hypothetical protein